MDELTNELYSEQLNEAFTSENDPGGSYTGNNLADPYGEPEQDADDL